MQSSRCSNPPVPRCTCSSAKTRSEWVGRNSKPYVATSMLGKKRPSELTSPDEENSTGPLLGDGLCVYSARPGSGREKLTGGGSRSIHAHETRLEPRGNSSSKGRTTSPG